MTFIRRTQSMEHTTSLKEIARLFLKLRVIGFGGPVAYIANATLFSLFLKISVILYGSGYVLFAFLDDELLRPGLLSSPLMKKMQTFKMFVFLDVVNVASVELIVAVCIDGPV